MKAARETSYSPYVMASKILQEIGRNTGIHPLYQANTPALKAITIISI